MERSRNESQATPQPGLTDVLLEATRKLTSQPLIYGVAVLLILAIAAGIAVDGLRLLLIPTLAVFVVGVLVWLASEYFRLQDKAVRVRATRLGKGASVGGVTGVTSSSGLDVGVQAKDVGDDARVVGIEFAQPQPGEDDPNEANGRP
jgi:hypothetical protein